MDGTMKVAVMNGIGKMGLKKDRFQNRKIMRFLLNWNMQVSAVRIYIIMKTEESGIIQLNRLLYWGMNRVELWLKQERRLNI